MDLSTDRPKITLPAFPKIETAGGGYLIGHQDHDATAWWKGAYNSAELDAIIRVGKRLQLDRARTSGLEGDEIRKSQVSWIYPSETTGWIFDRLAQVVAEVNARFFRFDLYGMLQGLQFTEYGPDGSHYTWHIDRGQTVGIRKLSLSLLLSDPDSFEGGDLEFDFGGDKIRAERERGLITLFPSWALHRVTPVTSGVRHSLVAWISGPPFR